MRHGLKTSDEQRTHHGGIVTGRVGKLARVASATALRGGLFATRGVLQITLKKLHGHVSSRCNSSPAFHCCP